MEKLENNLIPLLKILEEKTIITIKDWEEIKELMGSCFVKIQRQRVRLEASRDLWERKFKKLKLKCGEKK